MKQFCRVLSVILSLSLISCALPKRSIESNATTKYVPSQARGDVGLRKRVVVLPFIDQKSHRSMKTAQNARRAFINRLVSTNRIVVVSPNDLGKDVSNYLKAGKYDMPRLAKLAAASDITAVIEGTLMDLKAKKLGDEVGLFRKVTAQVSASVKIRVFSTKTQKEIFNDVREASVEASTRVAGAYSASSRGLDEDPRLVQAAINKALSGSMSGIVRSMDKMEWEGRIAMIRGDRIYVNAGRLSGLQVGDILRVSSEGEEVYDPESGVFIGKAPGRAKGTVEVVSYFGKDGAVAIIHSGGGFEQNDRVDLY